MTASTREKQLSPGRTPPRKRTRFALVPAVVLGLFMVCFLGSVTFPYWHIVQDKLFVDEGVASQGSAAQTKPRSEKELAAWQTRLRKSLSQALKIHLESSSSSAAAEQQPVISRIVEDKVVRTMMFNGNMFSCRRQTIEFQSHSGIPAFAYLLLPAKLTPGEKLPCVICLPGHGAGVDHAVGLDPDGSLMRMWDRTPRDFALFYACRGYAVLALEQAGIGRRSRAPATFAEKTECLFSDAAFRFTGRTTLGERVLDVISAVNLLEGRAEIDPARLAVMGISAGGTTALFSAALDDRIKCAVVVSAFSTYSDSIFRQLQCLCNYVPRLPQLADSAEIAALIAPRSLFIESGLTDDRFPARSAKVAFAKAREFFKLAGKTNNIDMEVCNHGHRCFFGKKSAEFLHSHL